MNEFVKSYNAMFVQVSLLYPIRTVINYQYTNGYSFSSSLKFLYKQEGIKRFYRGFIPGLIQGPLIKSGDLYINSYIKNNLHIDDIVIKTFFSSIIGSGYRCFFIPIDTVKTSLQIHNNFNPLKEKINKRGVLSLYNGVLPLYVGNFLSHYPWFLTYNLLDDKLPVYDGNKKIIRNGFLGFCCSATSDICVNFFKILKVNKQTHKNVNIDYPEIIKEIYLKEGLKGVLFRGLFTKIIGNGLQNMLFMILWKI